MVSLTEIRNRLQRSFTPDQAELIANLHVEMHDQLVTPHDFAELRSVVGELAESQQRTEQRIGELAESQQRTEVRVEQLAEAQQRTEVRVEQLAEAQQRTEVRVEQLAEAQQRTEVRVEQLAEAQQRTEVRVEQLAEAQQRTEVRVGELAEAQQRTESRVGDLADAQRRTENAVVELATSVKQAEFAIKDLAKQVGGLAATAGGNLEAYASERIPEVLAERFGFVVESCGTEAIEAGGKTYEFDAVIRGTIDGRAMIVLCEVKTNISEAEVRGFLRVVDRMRPVLTLSPPAAEVQPLFFGYRAAVVTQKLITGSGAWLVFPRGLVAAA
jgi:multidrug efflux pump subunit AcrA (membrane-fusion protein)